MKWTEKHVLLLFWLQCQSIRIFLFWVSLINLSPHPQMSWLTYRTQSAHEMERRRWRIQRRKKTFIFVFEIHRQTNYELLREKKNKHSDGLSQKRLCDRMQERSNEEKLLGFLSVWNLLIRFWLETEVSWCNMSEGPVGAFAIAISCICIFRNGAAQSQCDSAKSHKSIDKPQHFQQWTINFKWQCY